MSRLVARSFSLLLRAAQALWMAMREFGNDICGTPIAVLVALLVLFPVVFSGALRAATGWPIGIGFITSMCATLLFLWSQRRRVLKADQSQWPIGTVGWVREAFFQLAPVVAGLIGVWYLFNRDFSGFMNIDGWDGGSHLFLQRAFLKDFPAAYNGFVAQYAFSFWVETLLGLDSFRSVSLSFHIALALAVAVPVSIAVALARRSGTWPALLGVLASVVTIFALADATFFPQFHYLQGMGYYPQVFAIIPVAFLWLVDATTKTIGSRILGFCVGLFLLRYSYGLNLPDIAAALAILILVDARRGRPAVSSLGIALLCAAVYAYMALVPVFEIWGGIARHNINLVLATNIATALVLLVIILVAPEPAASGAGDRSLVSGIRFPLAVLALNAMSFSYFQATAGKPYYLQKYQAITLWLVAAAASLVAGHVAFVLLSCLKNVSRWRNSLFGVFVAAAAMACLLKFGPGFWVTALAPYRAAYLERVKAKGPPYQHLRPLVDRRAFLMIKKKLAESGKSFGGYITGNFPMFSFMNGAFGHHTGIQAFFSPKMEAGHCVFWVRPEDDIYPLGDQAEVHAWRNSLSSGTGVECSDYAVRWKATKQSLCTKCF